MDARTEAILAVVRTLPEHAATVSLRSPRGVATRTFRGALLYDYCRAAGRTPVPPSVGFGNYYFLATAEDGFQVTLTYFEVTPRATDKQVLLAFEQDGEPFRAGLRLVVPGDDLGGRSISGVVSIELRGVPSVEPQDTRPHSKTLSLSGLLERTGSLDAAALARFPAVEVVTQPTPRHGGVVMPPTRFTGVRVWDVLEDAGPVVDAAINEDIMRKIVVATSTDGYSAVIAPGEIDPRFMAGDAIIATAREGKPLAEDEGGFRLIVPFDKAVGRAIKSLASIELRQA